MLDRWQHTARAVAAEVACGSARHGPHGRGAVVIDPAVGFAHLLRGHRSTVFLTVSPGAPRFDLAAPGLEWAPLHDDVHAVMRAGRRRHPQGRTLLHHRREHTR
jgi:hypothetical protein